MLPEIEMLYVTMLLVTYILVTHILYIYKDDDEKCLIRQRTYNITYNIHFTLSPCFFVYFFLNNIHRTYKDIHRTHRTRTVRGVLLYAD